MEMPVVLVVENDEYQRELYEQELTDEGYAVWLAEDGSKAVSMVCKRRPDVVVLDLHMPGMDGLDALSRLLDVDHSLPVIIYSAYSCYKDNFMSWLADEYLVKSSDLKPLKAAIQRVLDKRAGHPEMKGATLHGQGAINGSPQANASQAHGAVFTLCP